MHESGHDLRENTKPEDANPSFLLRRDMLRENRIVDL